MSLLLYRLGHLCARRHWIVIATWVVIVVGVVVAARAVGSQTSDNLSLPDTGSNSATDLLDDKLPHQANGTIPIVLAVDSGRLDQGANEKAVKATVKSLSDSPYVRKAVSPLSEAGSDALSKDGRVGYVSLTLNLGPDELEDDEANEIIDAAQPAVDAGMKVAAGGYLGQEVSKPSTEWSERIGILAAIVILLLALGTVVAMSLPITIAIVGVITGLSTITLLGHVVAVPSVAPTLGTMIGLGVGIDYSLFIVTRYRRRLAEGLDVHEAIARSAATSGSAVAFAGGTVVIALLSLILAQIPLVSALGYSSAVVVVIAVAAALTLLPAILGLIGHRIESLRVPMVTPEHRDDQPHGWARWASGSPSGRGRRWSAPW